MNLSIQHHLYSNTSKDFSLKDYYPFGMVMPERRFSSENYRFGFGGEEQDVELYGNDNSYNYSLRMYDPRIMRFMSSDPLFQKFPYYSTYQFAGNSPIRNVDLEGAEDLPNEICNAAKNWGHNMIKVAVDYMVTKAVSTVYDAGKQKVEERLDEMVDSKNTKQGMTGVAGEYILGVGPESRSFGPDHPLTQSLAKSDLAVSAKKGFLEQNAYALKKGDLKSVTPFSDLMTWGLTGFFDDSGVLTESLDNASQMTGSATFTLSLSPDGKTFNYHVYDTKNEWSFKYHGKLSILGIIPDNHLREDGVMMGTTEQTYDWSEKFDATEYK